MVVAENELLDMGAYEQTWIPEGTPLAKALGQDQAWLIEGTGEGPLWL